MVKNIALVAHDSRKAELLSWVKFNAGVLKDCRLFCTGTTGRLVKDTLSKVLEPSELPEIECLLSGPLGGDFEIGAMIAEGKIDMLVFFCDNLIMQGHQNDVMGLVRLASLYNIPFATNRSTADFIITSPLFSDAEYNRIIPACIESYKNRKLK
ncbi:MAG TPA: methylglyoxal synthase [Rikenellaceae bacterium]|nr:methylglyoxal synthase [Rikenellaceae bacterium]HBH21213.1 methylglyoxal synthase [Rikenellaceae bacterium]